MLGPTLTMPSFDSASLFARSHSSPSIAELGKLDYKPPKIGVEELPRPASFTNIPNLIPNLDGQLATENGRQAPMPTPAGEKRIGRSRVEAVDEKKPNKLTKEERPRAESVGRRMSLVSRPRSWMQRVKSSSEQPGGVNIANTTPVDAPPVPQMPQSIRDAKVKSVSGSFATFARKSWISSSRSPSPKRSPGNLEKNKSADEQKTAPNPAVGVPPNLEKPPPPDALESPQKPPMRRTSTLQRLKQRPQSVLLTFTNIASANSSTSSLPSSMDNKSTPRTSTDKIPPVPKTFSTEKLHNLNLGLDARRRDELWSAFRSLDNDFTKFQSKSWSLKANIVRSAVLPFLKNHASHPSNSNLRPEDLERRVAILHKWWNGILEVLDGRQNQTVSGVDRPILLEACYCIMIRPEWRPTPLQSPPLSKRSSQSPARHSLSRKKSSASLQSTASQFITESVYHNTRTFFIQNLLAQVTFVVEKMSLRHAPASLVTFCGKAVAYAFFFVPGVADVLVRVWNLTAESLRRVADEFGLPKRPNPLETEEICETFPEHLRGLGWTSPKLMTASLRQNAMLSIMAAKVNWYGPWSARWCGRDSDLFFVFAKHYFILADQFMSPGLSIMAKSRAPGFLLVQSQILTVLDGTIHRRAPSDPLPITFDDVLAGADANAAALPLPSSNSSRPMAENRLIMLLRDFLSENSSDYDSARRSFAEMFSKLMQACARKTSLFDHSACFILCDFMEEALSIFLRFHQTHELESDHIDWYFWLDVCKKMLESQNSMSEIRLFSFIYGSWNLIASDDIRKGVVCLDWLLAEESFKKYFCHWSPMVRAYYMRLLCWRLCRDNGDASELDTKIFLTVSIRLKSIFAHYLFLKQSAERSRMLPPSSVPCYPAPGRRLLIIRNDSQAPSTNIFMSFDGIMPSATSSSGAYPQRPSKRHSLAALSSPDPAFPTLTSDSPLHNPKKRWSLLGKSFSPLDSQSTVPSPPGSTPGSPPKNLDDARRETALARAAARPPLNASKSSTSSSGSGSGSGSENPPSYRLYCFKFSLEWAQNFERNAKRGNGERRIASPRLPNAAQACIGARVPGVGNEVLPNDLGTGTAGNYAGRALAEWAIIVGECNNFVERRRMEGVPELRLVEVPILGVEGFRRFGG